jgi:hypothetical protein
VSAAAFEFRPHRAVTPAERSGSEWLTDCGIVLAVAAVLFTARIVCEQTLLAWYGSVHMIGLPVPQLVLDWIGLLCVLGGLAWTLVTVVRAALRRSRLTAIDLGLAAVILLCCALWLVTAQQWKLLVLRVHGAGHAPKSWLVEAAADGEIQLLDYLLANGADPDAPSANGQSALGAAAAAGQIAAARLLFERGAHLESRTRLTLDTPLIEAAQMNQLGMVRLLLDRGANVEARDVMGRNAVDWARENADAQMVDLILSRKSE